MLMSLPLSLVFKFLHLLLPSACLPSNKEYEGKLKVAKKKISAPKHVRFEDSKLSCRFAIDAIDTKLT
jgi:hypothetical protein